MERQLIVGLISLELQDSGLGTPVCRAYVQTPRRGFRYSPLGVFVVETLIHRVNIDVHQSIVQRNALHLGNILAWIASHISLMLCEG